MSAAVRSMLAAGAAVVTATALTVAAPEPAAPAPKAATSHVAAAPLRLTAAVQPLAVTDLPDLLTGWVQNLVPSAGAGVPTPQVQPLALGTSIGTFIENAYMTIEPWVEWGFELAAYVVGRIPWVGLLAPQIMIFYNTGEQIVQSIVFNFADWIDGQVGFLQGLRNIAVDTINAGIYFINQEIATYFPPLPPIPPIGGFAAAVPDEGVDGGDELVDDSDPPLRMTSFATEDAPEAEPEEPAQEPTDEVQPEEKTFTEVEQEEIQEEIEDTDPGSSTDSNGTVSAQGEVRGPVVAPGATPGDEPEDEPSAQGETETVTAETPETSDADESESSDTDAE
ncbi:hypothetical protein [Mycolicibacterium phlei]|uniref:hypothetical protein n=1 Tax=Mycolicibacterium phlei TaxID=1771 RepID=UPI00078CC54F|nr:hypothetical protein [Mycolicibacterium phlei]AMO62863.1 hypothetical protein MPHLCCUG_04075 [Mycolicibacterium phlei]VEG10963.1 PE family protein [Mycobacteroides chelonae]